MAYTYLLELHDLIDNKITSLACRHQLAANERREEDAFYLAGRLSALNEIDAFLVEHCDPSLPRKLLAAYRKKRTGG